MRIQERLRFLVALMVAVLPSIGASQEAEKTSIYPSGLNFSAPKYAAVDLLGLESSRTQSPTNLQQFATSLLSYDKKKGLGLSLTGSALGLGGGKNLFLKRYREGGSFYRQQRNSVLSLALVQDTGTDKNDLDIASGLTIPIFDQTDWRVHQEIFAKWRDLTAKVTALSGRLQDLPDLFSRKSKLPAEGTPVLKADRHPILSTVTLFNILNSYQKDKEISALLGKETKAELTGTVEDAKSLYDMLLKQFGTDRQGWVTPSESLPYPTTEKDLSTDKLEKEARELATRAKLLDKAVNDDVLQNPVAKLQKEFQKQLDAEYWNKPKLDVSLAGRWTSLDGSFDDSLKTNGGASWISYQSPLGKDGVFNLVGKRFWNLPFDTDGKGTTFVSTGGWQYGAGLRFGDPGRAYFVEWIQNRRDGVNGEKYNDTSFQAGYETKVAESQWLQFSISNKDLPKNSRVVFGLNLAFDVSPKSGIKVHN